MRISSIQRVLVYALTLTVAGCGGGGDSKAPGSSTTPAASRGPVSANKADYPVFPNADEGADSSVTADQGGKGFTGAGWETNTDYDLIGDPRAVKGGVFRYAMTDFPATLRYLGPNTSVWNQSLSSLVYETLLGQDPVTLEYIPVLATHWQVSPDKMTYRFRLDPNARFSDGVPVTANDVVATWKFYTDRTNQSPFHYTEFAKFEQPTAESKYIISVKAKEKSWMSLLIFSSMFIYPEHVVKGLTGAQYLKEWNDKMLPGTGPYAVGPGDIDKGKTISIRRRKDYWAAAHRRNIGTANFDELRNITVRDRNLEFEMVKRGDLDFYMVNRAQMWVQELDFDKIKQGVLVKKKIWNHEPHSLGGIAFNMRRKPYDDVRVRKALRFLYNRDLMIEKLAFNQYVPMNSVFPHSVYENNKNEKVKYNPGEAMRLLAEAGWKDRNAQGQLVKDGTQMTLEILYYDRASERYFTIFQEDLRKVGITLNLRYVTPETAFKLLDERQFGMFSVAYGGGSPFPIPSQFFDSKQADAKASNNITGFKNARADEILEVYEQEFDLKKRIVLLQELDSIVSQEHPYILDWSAPYTRIVFWNKFGHPKGVITRIGDYRDPPGLWWFDDKKSNELEAAVKDPSKTLPVEAAEDKYWLEFERVEEKEGVLGEKSKS